MSQIVAFAVEHVARLTGLSERRIRYWDSIELVQPSVLAGSDHAYSRIYSFRDVVGIRTLAVLRVTHKIPLQQLRKVGAWLGEHHETPWASLRLGVAGKKVIYYDPITGIPSEGTGQHVLSIAIVQIAHDVEERAKRLRERTPEQHGKLKQHRYVLHNAKTVAGTRITTQSIWELRARGLTDKEIISEYPRLTQEDVVAAINFENKLRKTRAA